MRQNGGYIGYTPNPSSASTSGVWTMDEVARYRQAGTWPIPFSSPPVSGEVLWLDPNSAGTALDASSNTITVDSTAIATWKDSSGYGRDATQSTSGNRPTWRSSANGRNGYSVVQFNGSSQWLGLTSGSHFAFGTGDYTIESWINFASITGQQTFFVAGTTGSASNWAGYFTGTKFDIYNNGIGPQKFSGACNVSANTWYHFAVCRASGTTRVFLNGSQVSSATDSFSYASTGGARIGHDGISGLPINAKIQNLLIYNGQALYTSNFTPWLS